jgi:protein-L-isoaspartate(D-aspartate) O-methyltransferase
LQDEPTPAALFARAISERDVEAALEVCHPDIQFSSMLAQIEGTTYRGHDGVRRYFEDVAAAWDEWHVGTEEVRTARDGRLVIVINMRVRGKGSGVLLEERMAHVWELRDGRLWRSTIYRDVERALEAVGLEPDGGIAPGPQRLADVVRGHGVRDEGLLAAIAEIPREAYVPPELSREAYTDRPLPIPHEQVTTQPSLIAQMVEALALTGGEKVLEIGTGYGWQTALLARLARAVWSMERWPDLLDTARANLERGGFENARLVLGDGTEGLPGGAPYDAVIVSAAFGTVPPPLVDQLAAGGRLVQPIGPGGHDDVTLFEKRPEGLVAIESIVPAHFVKLFGRYGYARDG